jgi:outer membrane lipoprotein-sorting protein
MWMGKTELIVDGVSKTMDTVPMSLNGRTMVPVRFAAENVGCDVQWFPATSEISILYNHIESDSLPTPGLSNPVEPPTQPPTTEATSVSQTGTGGALTGKYMDIFASEVYYMKYSLEVDGEDMGTEVEMAINKDDMATKTEFEMDGEVFTSRIVTKGNSMYMINDETQTVMVMNMPVDAESNDYAKYEYIGSGTGTVKGKTLPYEEYELDSATMKYYFDGNDLYAIETKDSDTNTVALMIIHEFSTNIPADMFDIPADYEIMSFPF